VDHLSPVNQQIATRTISKLGFKVSAAWNGKEALDYLEAAKKGDETMPDIILMDVQMPVIDGYKTTHLLRHHMPYKNFIKNVPIVAMTASAIQGDREKCKKAGMDDYLAKPVKSKILERMLVRWSRTKRRSSLPQPSSESDCSEPGEHCSNTDGSSVAALEGSDDDDDFFTAVGKAIDDEGREPLSEDEKRNLLTPRPLTRGDVVRTGSGAGIDGVGYRAASGPSGGGRQHPVMRRRETDEQALQSRDEQLMGAAGGELASTPLGHGRQLPPTAREALTEANVERLAKEEGESRHRRRS